MPSQHNKNTTTRTIFAGITLMGLSMTLVGGLACGSACTTPNTSGNQSGNTSGNTSGNHVANNMPSDLTTYDKKNTQKEIQAAYQHSLDTWQAYKQKHPADVGYTFTLTTSSFTGFGTETKLTIKNNVVSSRDFHLIMPPNGEASGINLDALPKDYHEDQATLNTHPDGAKPTNLDDIYKQCKEALSVNPDDNWIYFETFADTGAQNDLNERRGLIKTCGFVPHNCADDCFRGVRVSEIQSL